MKLIDKDALVSEIEKRRDAALIRQHNLEAIGQETVLNEMEANELNRIITFINTLEVKEVDSKLSLEDISILRQIMFDYNRQVRNEMSIPNNEDYCKEILKRFKAQKGE